MRKLVDTFPGSGFPKLIGGGSSNITGQFTFAGTGPLLFGQPDFGGDLTKTINFGGLFGGNPADQDTSVVMGLSGVAVVRGPANEGSSGSTWWEFEDGDTMRMSRETDGNNDPQMGGASVLEFNNFPVTLQRGIVTVLGSSTTGTTTLASPVAVDLSAVVYRGNHVLGNSEDPDEWLVNIYLSDVVLGSYTTITAETGNVGGSNMEIHWTILEFGNNANVNVQQQEAIIPAAAASVTTTLSPAVDVAKTVLWPMGPGVIGSSTPARGQAHEITLTNSTTVTTSRFAGGDGAGSFDALHQWFNTLEFN